MSRTSKGGKGGGYEYWTARPFNRGGSRPGAYSKRRTHRAERQQGKQEAEQQQKDHAVEYPFWLFPA
jgi:hypothetical protein